MEQAPSEHDDPTPPTGVLGRLLRYSAVSIVGIVATQALLYALHVGAEVAATPANAAAVCTVSVPAYFANRRWVWGREGRHSVRREVVPFWVFTLAGLVVSTAAVDAVTRRVSAPWAENAASVGAFGALWVAKYLVLDRLVFGIAHPASPRGADAEDLGELLFGAPVDVDGRPAAGSVPPLTVASTSSPLTAAAFLERRRHAPDQVVAARAADPTEDWFLPFDFQPTADPADPRSGA